MHKFNYFFNIDILNMQAFIWTARARRRATIGRRPLGIL